MKSCGLPKTDKRWDPKQALDDLVETIRKLTGVMLVIDEETAPGFSGLESRERFALLASHLWGLAHRRMQENAETGAKGGVYRIRLEDLE